MAAPPEADYAELLQRIEQACEQIEALRQEPSSPKRDAALALLEAVHVRAILALRQLGP
jgi:hypothetical protein